MRVYAAQPREGTETIPREGTKDVPELLWFMQLNPARGRKRIAPNVPLGRYPRHGLCISTPRGDGNPDPRVESTGTLSLGLCSSTPRGDGNQCGLELVNPIIGLRVYAAQSREGTETTPMHCTRGTDAKVYAAQPREGTETHTQVILLLFFIRGLCSSTPRGDGNPRYSCRPEKC